MALDLGTLVAHVELDRTHFDNGQKAVENAIRKIESKAPEIPLDADGRPAKNEMRKVERDADDLDSQRPTIRVNADTAAARGEMEDIVDDAGDIGDDAGEDIGDGILGGLSDKLGALSTKSGPIVGAVIGAIAAIAAIHPGVQIIEAIVSDMARAREGLFSARTGLDPATAERWGKAVGESYAQGFADSVDDAMGTAQAALRSGLLAPGASDNEITSMVNDLETLSQILEEDTPRLARAAAQAIRTGLAGDATEAFDLLAKGGQAGLNVSEDLLDTVTEYGTQFRKLGIDGKTAFGLMSQAVRNGARDTDKAADALKEFSIRAVDGSDLTREAFEGLGLDADEMALRVALGGEQAATALDETFKALRGIEDPVKRAMIAVGLFGTQSEDLGDALGAMDLGTARTEFEDTAGTVSQAAEDIANNTGTQVEIARRSVETSVEGIKGALAEAFAPPAQDIATWVQTHRGEITEFVAELAGAGFSVADGFLAVSGGVLSIATSVVSTLRNMTDGFYAFIDGILNAADRAIGWIPGQGDQIRAARENFQGERDLAVGNLDSILGGMDSASGGLADAREFLAEIRDRFDEVAQEAIERAHAADAAALPALTPSPISVSNTYEFNGPIYTRDSQQLIDDARAQAEAQRRANVTGRRQAI